MRVLSYHKSKDRWWFRIFGYGFAGTSVNADWIPFSIRHGYRKTVKLFGYHIQFLKKNEF
jgi:hypothetical protein